ncbi:MAG: hypothetical protein KJO65_09550 [Gemmatimonadetes bacterium]|nr:hypothetical protein [Gemmatimonadota bacterium]
MGDQPFRRTLTVLLVYAAGGWVVWMLGGWLRQVLVLPLVFAQLLKWGLVLGGFVAVSMAWFYPVIATAGGHDGPSDAGAGDG